ncbi:MAG TPA: recombinase family protein [Legionella sp.]|nr:recombinase family protein [Legionella sp.]
MKAGIYARVSTHDQHTLKLQVDAMHKYAADRGWEISKEISEMGLILYSAGLSSSSVTTLIQQGL